MPSELVIQRSLLGAASQASPIPDSLELSDSYHEAVEIDFYKVPRPSPKPDASDCGPVSSVVREHPSSTHKPFTISRKPVNSALTEGTPYTQIPPSNDPKPVWPRNFGGSDSSRSIHKTQQILKTEETEKPREVDDPQQWPRGRKVLHSIIPSVVAFLT